MPFLSQVFVLWPKSPWTKRILRGQLIFSGNSSEIALLRVRLRRISYYFDAVISHISKLIVFQELQ